MQPRRQSDGSDLGKFVREVREARGDVESRLHALARHVENMEGGTDSTRAQSEGLAALGMDVAELKRKIVRLRESLQETRVLTDSFPVLREAVQSLDSKVENLKKRIPRTSLGEDFERIEEMISLRTDVDNLTKKARKRTDLQHGVQVSAHNLPVLRDAIPFARGKDECHACTNIY